MAGGDRLCGGIWGLLDLIEEHRPAVEYDWRTRFLMPLDAVPDAMPWDEAGRLAVILRNDPSSMTAASLEGWSHPISREALVLMDLFDLEHAVNSKKRPKPHPGRPWKDRTKRHIGKAGNRTRAEVITILDQARDGTIPV